MDSLDDVDDGEAPPPPAPPERAPLKIAGTFDIEAHSWDSFVVGAIYDGRRPQIFYDGDKMIDEMRRRGGVWFGHAAGIYDALYVLERARVRGIACQVDRSQHRVTRIVMGKLTIRDSYSLWPVPLDDICGAIGRKVPHLPWACQCGQDTCGCGCGGCGGYCRIGDRAADGDPDLEQYVIDDCKALYDGALYLDEKAAESKITLKGTLGQTAWIAAQDELGVPDSDIPWDLWRHAKRGDKGGRACVVRPRAAGPGTHHDICNAYPAQLAKTALPVGGCRELGGKRALAALVAGRPGIYSMTVRVPDNLFLPPLSWSIDGKLTFPVGRFSGTWALPEIAAALERGVSIDTVHAAIIWEATAPIFAPLVERWYAIRREVGRKTPFGQWIGRLAKALTGKFAEKPDRSRVTMHPEDIKICLRKDRCRHGCTGRCGAYQQIDLFGHIYAIPYSRLGDSAYPQWSAYLRAGTRVQWLEQAERYGEDLVAGNTDSIWSLGRKSPHPLGDGLGEWELQGAWEDIEIRSVSVYAYRDPAEATMERDETATRKNKRAMYKRLPGPLHIRGIPGLTEADWKRGGGVIDRGIVTFGNAVGSAQGLFKKRQRRWTLPKSERTIFGDRRLGAAGDITYPLDAAELRELARLPPMMKDAA